MATVGCSLIVLVVSVVYYRKGCGPTYTSDDYDPLFTKNVLQPTTRILGILYFLLALMFFVIAFVFVHFIKKHHTDFYKQYIKLLWITVFVLTTPLMLRCLMDSLQSWKAFSDYTNRNVAVYNLFFFLLTTYILVLS